MNKLPLELIDRIVWFAERSPGQERYFSTIEQSPMPNSLLSQFSRLATFNRTWKEAVEIVTFRLLRVKSEGLESLQSIVTGNRRNYLSWISLEPGLPTYSDEVYKHKESRLDRHTNNETFTKTISDLFRVLRTWEDNCVKNGVRLYLVGASSPTDFREGYRYVQVARWADCDLRLVQPENMPTSFNVQHLTIESWGGRILAPSVAPDLELTLPELGTVDWRFLDYGAGSEAGSDQDSLGSDYDPEWESAASPKARGESRAEFANKLSPMHFRSLNSAEINFYHEPPLD